MDILLWIIIGVFFLLTYVGVVVPLVPDVPFMLGGFLVYQFGLSKNGLGATFWLVVISVTCFLVFIEYIATGIAVKKSGGTTLSVFIGMLGLLVFPFIMGPLGVVLGPFLAVFVFECIKRGNIMEALKVALGTFVGLIGSIVLKFSVVTAVIIWFFISI